MQSADVFRAIGYQRRRKRCNKVEMTEAEARESATLHNMTVLLCLSTMSAYPCRGAHYSWHIGHHDVHKKSNKIIVDDFRWFANNARRGSGRNR